MSHVSTNKKRAAFRIDGDIFVSAGALFYIKADDGQTYFIMQKRKDKNYLEDIGGKSESYDTKIEDVVKREVLEELNCFAPEHLKPKNNIITADFLDNSLDKSEQILIPESKYVLFFVKLPIDKKFDLSQYHEYEYNEKGQIMIGRTLLWVNRNELCNSFLHPRILDLESFFP